MIKVCNWLSWAMQQPNVQTCINGLDPQCEDCVRPGGPNIEPMSGHMPVVLALQHAIPGLATNILTAC